MLKTNSKAVKAAIKNHIINGFKASDYEREHGTTIDDYGTICRIIYNDFFRVEIKNDGRRNACHAELFADYVSGLPGLIDSDFMLCAARDTLGDWLQESETEKARYTEDAAEKLIINLLWREINENMCAEV